MPGIDTNRLSYMVMRDESRLRLAVNVLLECGHPHNFIVKKDGNAIGTTELGFACLRKAGF